MSSLARQPPFQGFLMGIYDRPYLHDDERSSGWTSGRSMVVNLIIVNVVIWLAGAFEPRLEGWLALQSNLFYKPWQCWQLVTYGFVHHGVLHILFNMLFLYFFGRDVEGIYGRYEFLRLYLVAIVLAGLVWVVATAPTTAADRPIPLVGASGGVMAVVILFVLHFPRQTIYIWGVLPVPAWVLGVFFVVGDLLGFASPREAEGGVSVANIAHLTGAAFAFVYFRAKLNLGRLVPRRLGEWGGQLFRPKLRVHDPDRDARDLNRQVDAILEKISREGESSLTKKERRTLEEASRRYQRRRQ